MKHKPGSIIFLIVPESGNTRSFSLSVRILKLLVLAALVLAASLVALAAYHQRIARQFLILNRLVEKNRQLERDNRTLLELRQALGEVYAREDRIRGLARDAYRAEAASRPDSSAAGPGPLVSEKEIDDFVKNVLRQKNLDYIKSKDRGAKQRLLVEAVPNILPVDGWISRGFAAAGGDSGEDHSGVDIAAPEHTPVKATADGMVVFADWKPPLGYTVEINHSYGFRTVYGHNQRLLVRRGDLVKRGDLIAFSGNTGRSSAPHLHYEVIKNGVFQDPVLFMLQ